MKSSSLSTTFHVSAIWIIAMLLLLVSMYVDTLSILGLTLLLFPLSCVVTVVGD